MQLFRLFFDFVGVVDIGQVIPLQINSSQNPKNFATLLLFLCFYFLGILILLGSKPNLFHLIICGIGTYFACHFFEDVMKFVYFYCHSVFFYYFCDHFSYFLRSPDELYHQMEDIRDDVSSKFLPVLVFIVFDAFLWRLSGLIIFFILFLK